MLIARPIVVASRRKVREDLSFDELMLLGEGSLREPCSSVTSSGAAKYAACKGLYGFRDM